MDFSTAGESSARVYASLGFLIGSTASGSVQWLEANRGYSEWDGEFGELLDFISGVNEASDVEAFLRAEGAEPGTVGELVDAGLLIELSGSDLTKMRGLVGRRLVETSDLVETTDPADGVDTVGVLESRVARGERVRVTEPMLSVLSDPSGEDIPTVIATTSQRYGVDEEELAARFMSDLDLVIGSRAAFIGH